MPKKAVKRKSSYGQSSASDRAKRFTKYRASQDEDDFHENEAKRTRINRYFRIIDYGRV